MPYAAKNLGGLAYVNGCTLWHYRSAADSTAVILSPGYFDDAAVLLRRGDVVIVQDSFVTRLVSVNDVVRPEGLAARGSVAVAGFLGLSIPSPNRLLTEDGDPITTEAGESLLAA